jgi:hypothetical protein
MGTKKQDVYPSRFFSGANFPDTPMVLQIETVHMEEMRDGDDAPVVYFVGKKSGLILKPTVWNQIADVMAADGVSKYDSDDYTKWKDHWVELYRDDTVQYQGKPSPGVRVRKPGMLPVKAKGKKPKPAPKPDYDDEIPH